MVQKPTVSALLGKTYMRLRRCRKAEKRPGFERNVARDCGNLSALWDSTRQKRFQAHWRTPLQGADKTAVIDRIDIRTYNSALFGPESTSAGLGG